MSGRANRLRRAEVISVASAGAVFVIVAVLGVMVWLRSGNAPEVAVAPTPTVAVPRTPALTPVVSARASPSFSPSPIVEASSTPEAPNPLDLIADWPEDRPFSVLFLGLDRRPGEGGGRTDAIILAHVEPRARAATLVSIPRDICVANCRTDPFRINSVWQAEGPEALRRRVANLLGVQVDYWVTLDFNGFKRLVDFFGGVEVDVESTIYDPSYPNATDTGFEPFHVEAGPNHFNGDNALRYVRTRHQDGAFAREVRQQQILLALVEQVISPQTLVESPAFLSELSNAFESNLPPDLLPSMAKLGMQIGSARTVSGAIRPEDGMVRAVVADNGAYVLQPNVPLIHAYTADLMRRSESLPPPDAEPQVELANRQQPAS
ncbi:MAG: LCP family protein [Chloroflexota bacterium]|nr:LCP family protein [Chloroflexota bacterium]MDE2921157.1 LCP family protein [Chloroflexota bacterium]